MKYRRCFQPGGTYFFTVVTYKRNKIFLQENACKLFKQALLYVQNNHPFQLTAYCICPDHIHMVWELPDDDSNYPTRWRLIKSHFSRNYQKADQHLSSTSQNNPIWQRRYWEHLIRDEIDLIKHIEYIHYNPVKHGLADAPGKWEYSSFHDYADQGLYQQDWGVQGEFGYLDKFGNE